MKYVVVENEDGVREIFLFPRHVNHDDFAEVLHYIKVWKGQDWHRQYRKPISAGFVSRDWQCYGRSETLNLDSRPEDTKLLAVQFS